MNHFYLRTLAPLRCHAFGCTTIPTKAIFNGALEVGRYCDAHANARLCELQAESEYWERRDRARDRPTRFR